MTDVIVTGRFGAIPDAVLARLQGKQDLGIHTEMFSDGVVDLVEAGVITGARKRIHTGVIVSSFVLGTERLYRFIDRNPAVSMHDSSYTNDPRVIAAHEEMVAVNSAIEVDLTGQVCADSIGYRLYSGVGGQMDFIRGAALSKGGKPIIALPSLAAGGSALAQLARQREEHAGLVGARHGLDVERVARGEGVEDFLDQHLGGGCASGDAQRLDAVELGPVDLGGARQNVRPRAGGQPDAAKPSR